MEFRIVNDPRLLEKVYAFRYEILREKEATREIVAHITNGLENDDYDAFSIHFAACDKNEDVIACTRLIHHSPIGLPTLNNMKHSCLPQICDPKHLGEFSRIFVSPKLRGIKQLHPLFDSLKLIGYTTMKELDIQDTVGVLEPPFFRLLRMLGFPYTKIGELQSYFGLRYPARLNTRALYEANLELYRKNKIS